MITKLTKWFVQKAFNKHGGHCVFYITYNNKLPAPNVWMHSTNIELQNDVILNELLKLVADRVRLHKDKFDELLEV